MNYLTGGPALVVSHWYCAGRGRLGNRVWPALAAEAFEGILELNFERDASLAGLFPGASVKETVPPKTS